MSMKKGFCIRCVAKEPRRRIFNVNSEAEKCYCPHCMKEYKPKDAIAHYNHFIEYITDQADMTLRVARRPDVSYQKYADVLEYEPDYVPALLGRISSLIYQSTLRHSRFNDAISLIDLDLDRFHLVSSRSVYTRFLKSSKEMAEAYTDRLYKRLTFKNYFYDSECVKLYVERLLEIIRFYRFLEKELKFVGEIEYVNIFVEEIRTLDLHVHDKFTTLDGMVYNFIEVSDSITLSLSEKRVHTGVEKFHPKTLNENGKKFDVIKDVMFRSNSTMYRFINVGVGFSMGMGTVGLILLIICLFFIGKELFWLFFISGAAFTLVGFFFLFLQSILRRQVRKSRY